MSRLDRARALLAEAFRIDPSLIPDGARLGDFEQWDSLGHARMLLAVEEAIGRPLDPDEAVTAESLEAVAALLDIPAGT